MNLKKVIFSLFLFTCSHANAGLITQTNSYTYFEVGNGLEWVYAAPCAIDTNPSGTCNSNPLNLIDGFHFASVQEWTDSFSSLSELVSAFTSTTISQDDICSAEYFGSIYSHCDFGDLSSGYISGAPSFITDSGKAGHAAAEAFLVRTSNSPAQDIPEPSTLAIFGLALLGLASRRFKKTSLIISDYI